MKNKPNMYKVWHSKQMSGFCGTRVRVGMYSGEVSPDKQCPNCRRRETAAHLILCPDNDRTRLLIENVDKVSKWLDTGSRTDPELAYWIHKYILMQGDEPFSMLGTCVLDSQIYFDARRQTILNVEIYVLKAKSLCRVPKLNWLEELYRRAHLFTFL
jgi:hypothetical protein